MNYQPIFIGACRECAKVPTRIEWKGWFSSYCRIACDCGMAGAWRRHDSNSIDNAGRVAASGWHGLPLFNCDNPPPPPRKP